MTVIFVVAADGSVSRQNARQNPPGRQSRLPEIQEKLADAKFPAAEIVRLILEELARVIEEMVECGRDGSAARLKNCAGQVTALCALQRLVERADACSKKDLLNFDGPKFQFVFARLVALFKEAIEQALGEGHEAWSQSILKHFRDLVAVKEHDLRRETERIGACGEQQQ